MATQNIEEVLSKLSSLQESYELSIIKISEPISAQSTSDATGSRGSDVSTDAFENPSPAVLETDLTHYKELFSKLRFSYLEQVTKEKFLRAIVGDPPLIVEHQENVELERQLVEIKANLKAQKLKVAELVAELEEKGRELARRHQSITQQSHLLTTLPPTIKNLESSIQNLQSAHPPPSPSNPTHQHLPLQPTLSLLSSQKSSLAHLNHQLSSLQSTLPRKTLELERLEAELRPLESKRLGSLAGAREARRRKEEGAGGVGDDLEERGRWWRGVETGLKELLDVDGRQEVVSV
ncbi:hypothetical protein FGG08_004597 [Glutinoglossum americanum]|uniref:Kinetochore protein Sos7 coiled-coil domain-containing protein n=1 Tax=Glutinoglossum americanum TaxID=1670608 RepID=A0A9P8HZZ8_9PEZI|nr:hypothetical protein FGG08_004597 [Glutinoglossum americanum]